MNKSVVSVFFTIIKNLKFNLRSNLEFFMKKRIFSVFLLLFALKVLIAQPKKEVKEGAILHCWCWSFKTIEENLEDIKAAGFTALQTSPANTCVVGDYGELNFMSDDLTGKWYYHYQPTDWKIGNYQLGSRDDFISMCKKADELGIYVIVDVLPNHTTPRLKSISPEFIEAVGGMEKLYHKNNDHGIRDYSNRLECTTAQMGGLPDVNTENPLFQSYYMKYVNDLIDCGADGFRYDTAKHIGLPDDPKDPYSKENNFWPIFTGKQDINGEKVHKADELFIYGEVLQGDNSREASYAKLFPVTASNYGGILRMAVRLGKLNAKGLSSWKHPAPDNIVTWVESHDTYANYGESAKLTNWQLRMGWAIVCARAQGTPLFFNRPQGAESTQFPGVSKIGDIGNDEFKNPEVVAVNAFRKQMIGEGEELLNGKTTSVLFIKRGEKGVVMINTNTSGAEKVQLKIALPDGIYTDKANGINFTAKDGILTGRLPRQKIAVVY